MEENTSKQTEIMQVLKDKLNIGADEAKKIFHSIESKISDNLEFDEMLKVVRTTITKHPVKSLLIAFALGIIISKFLQK